MNEQQNDELDNILRGDAKIEGDFLKKDTTLHKEFTFRKEVQAALQQEHRSLLKADLAASDQRFFRQQRLQKLLIISGLSFLIIASIWLFNSSLSTTSTSEQIFATYYEPFPNIAVPLMKGQNEATEREQAFQWYEQGNYEKALPIFESLTDTIAIFYRSIIQLQQKEAQSALTGFQIAKSIPNQSVANAAEWYLALSYLQAQQLTTAQALFSTISQTVDHPFQEKAQQILQENIFNALE